MKIAVDVDYRPGEIVYHVAADDGCMGIVTGYLIRPTGVIYQVTWGNTRSETGHFAAELTSEKPL